MFEIRITGESNYRFDDDAWPGSNRIEWVFFVQTS